jgi:hypothetical protein
MDSKELRSFAEAYKAVHAPQEVDEAVYGGDPKKEAPKDDRMVVTNADKKANTKAYQNFKAGVKGYKAADHMGEEVVEEGLRSAVKRLLGGGKKEAESSKPESRGEQLRKKYNVKNSGVLLKHIKQFMLLKKLMKQCMVEIQKKKHLKTIEWLLPTQTRKQILKHIKILKQVLRVIRLPIIWEKKLLKKVFVQQ